MDIKNKIRILLNKDLRYIPENKKIMHLYLENKLTRKIDLVSKKLSKIKNKHVPKNFIIEQAVEIYVDSALSMLDDELNADAVEEFDTVIFPAHNDGFQDTFIEGHMWYPVRMHDNKISKVKYIALYRSAPISGITHYARVKEIYEYSEDPTKKEIKIYEPKELSEKIHLGTTHQSAMRSPRYTTLEKLKEASEVKELFNKK